MPLLESPKAVMEAPGSTPHRRASFKILSRNIDNVVLGNMLFDTWYYSPYPDSIIIGSGPTTSKASEARNGGLVNGTKHMKPGITCSRLHVCPLCFVYSPREEDYLQHLLHHQEPQAEGVWPQPVPESAFMVYDWEGYGVWEVDGEREKLYCQNLSLFGKLFLEQKSVFFDTGGFKYYVLTHTPPEMPAAPPKLVAAKGHPRGLTSHCSEPRCLGSFPKRICHGTQTTLLAF